MRNHIEAISFMLYVGLGCLLATTVALSTDIGSDGNVGVVGGSIPNNSEYIELLLLITKSIDIAYNALWEI